MVLAIAIALMIAMALTMMFAMAIVLFSAIRRNNAYLNFSIAHHVSSRVHYFHILTASGG